MIARSEARSIVANPPTSRLRRRTMSLTRPPRMTVAVEAKASSRNEGLDLGLTADGLLCGRQSGREGPWDEADGQERQGPGYEDPALAGIVDDLVDERGELRRLTVPMVAADAARSGDRCCSDSR